MRGVHVAGAYPGIDLVFYGNGSQIEYDFLVNAGADTRSISLSFPGAKNVKVNASGDLEIATADGVLRQHKPRVFQMIAGQQQEVAASYRLADGHVGLKIAGRRGNGALRIDPVLSYASFIGGTKDDVGEGMAVDGTGAFIISGKTNSTGLPCCRGGSGNQGFHQRHGRFHNKVQCKRYVGVFDIPGRERQ